ncbi:expressed unknown protein [Seminavis robusta]|uniref:Uncharacterized protein n=1 Tax=Seminavis robusta TaxID=568900 RepID=A0A9N8DCC7_9STRA|nr:expressed unknown protein [Seminavis robusta]|eukprot:Sro14_g010730.1 n/a (1342) ;mRNA; f:132776-136801
MSSFQFPQGPIEDEEEIDTGNPFAEEPEIDTGMAQEPAIDMGGSVADGFSSTFDFSTASSLTNYDTEQPPFDEEPEISMLDDAPRELRHNPSMRQQEPLVETVYDEDEISADGDRLPRHSLVDATLMKDATNVKSVQFQLSEAFDSIVEANSISEEGANSVDWSDVENRVMRQSIKSGARELLMLNLYDLVFWLFRWPRVAVSYCLSAMGCKRWWADDDNENDANKTTYPAVVQEMKVSAAQAANQAAAAGPQAMSTAKTTTTSAVTTTAVTAALAAGIAITAAVVMTRSNPGATDPVDYSRPDPLVCNGSIPEDYEVKTGITRLVMVNVTADEVLDNREGLENAMRDVYNNGTGGCDDEYERFMLENELVLAENITNDDDEDVPVTFTVWESEVSCNGCPDTNPIFDDGDDEQVDQDGSTLPDEEKDDTVNDRFNDFVTRMSPQIGETIDQGQPGPPRKTPIVYIDAIDPTNDKGDIVESQGTMPNELLKIPDKTTAVVDPNDIQDRDVVADDANNQAPSATTTNNQSPSATNTNNQAPSATTTNNQAPSATNNQAPSATGNQAPSATGNQAPSSTTNGNQSPSAAYSGPTTGANNNAPSSTANRAPSSVSGNAPGAPSAPATGSPSFVPSVVGSNNASPSNSANPAAARPSAVGPSAVAPSGNRGDLSPSASSPSSPSVPWSPSGLISPSLMLSNETTEGLLVFAAHPPSSAEVTISPNGWPISPPSSQTSSKQTLTPSVVTVLKTYTNTKSNPGIPTAASAQPPNAALPPSSNANGNANGNPNGLNPTRQPTTNPTVEPTQDPTPNPTEEPTPSPTEEPTDEPTPNPTEEPTLNPTLDPISAPTSSPTTTETVYVVLDRSNTNNPILENELVAAFTRAVNATVDIPNDQSVNDVLAISVQEQIQLPSETSTAIEYQLTSTLDEAVLDQMMSEPDRTDFLQTFTDSMENMQAIDLTDSLDEYFTVTDTYYTTFEGTSGGLINSHDLATAFTEAFNSLPLPEGSPSIIEAAAVGEIPLESGIAVEFTVSSNPSGISEQVLDSSNLAQIIQSISDSLSGGGAQAVEVLTTLDGVVVPETFYVTFDGTSGGLVDSHDLGTIFTEAVNSLPLQAGSPQVVGAIAVGEIPLESGIAVEFSVSSNPSGISEQVLDASHLAEIIQSITDSLSGSGAQAVDVLSTLDNIVVDDTFYVTFDGTSGGLVDSHDLAAAFTEAFNSLPLPEGSPSIIAATAVGEIPLESGIAVEFSVSSSPSGISEQVLDSSNLAQIIQSISDSLSGGGAQAVEVLTTLDGVVVPETFYVTFDGTSGGLVDSHDLGTIFTEAVNSLPLQQVLLRLLGHCCW